MEYVKETPRNIKEYLKGDIQRYILDCDFYKEKFNTIITRIKDIDLSRHIKLICTIKQGVFHGVFKPLFRPCIIKTYIKSNKDKIELTRIIREFIILSIIKHPYIYEIYSIIETESSIYLITKYYPEGDLSSIIIAHKTINEELCIKIIYQLLQVLDYLHNMGIAHRDIKPQNILLDDNYNIKLCDFGFATKIIEYNNTPLGTLQYAAPEILNKSNYRGDEIDIYSSGLTLFSMLTGKHYNKNNTSNNIYPYNKDLNDLLIKMLEKDTIKRYNAMKCLNMKLFKNMSFDNVNIKYNMFDTIKLLELPLNNLDTLTSDEISDDNNIKE